MDTKVTQKYIKDTYSYKEILNAAPEIERRRVQYDIEDITLASLLDSLNRDHPNVPFNEVSFECEIEYDYNDSFSTTHAVLWYDHTLNKDERYHSGLAILQKREQAIQYEKDRQKIELKEWKRLKKKFGGK